MATNIIPAADLNLPSTPKVSQNAELGTSNHRIAQKSKQKVKSIHPDTKCQESLEVQATSPSDKVVISNTVGVTGSHANLYS